MRPARPGEDPALKLIHGAILSGTILFFGVVYFLFGDQAVQDVSPALRWAWLAAAIIAVFVAGYVRGRIGPNPDAEQVRTGGLIIWCLSEGAALLGMASTIVTGDMSSAIGATLIAVFLLIYHRPSELG